MFIGLLKKISSSHNNLRTDTVEGVFDLPVASEDFVLYGEGLEFGTRIVRTTPVEEVTKEENIVTFKTRNSVYKLFIEKEVEVSNGK